MLISCSLCSCGFCDSSFRCNTVLLNFHSSNILENVGAMNYSIRSPIGVAGLISPWNLPIYLLTFKIAPAIAAGNTVVCKPSEMTSVTAWMMAKVLNEAGTVTCRGQPVQ